MTTVTTYQVEDWFTADDLGSMPDDGQRYELVDGEVWVTPSPRERHQRVSGELHARLREAAPRGLRVYAAPLDVRLAPRRQVQPDLLVVADPVDDVPRIETVPLLVVEILSRATAGRDRLAKRRLYEQAGVPSYWLVDPSEPSLTALELADGRYRQLAVVTGEQVWTAQRPYPVALRPADLVR